MNDNEIPDHWEWGELRDVSQRLTSTVDPSENGGKLFEYYSFPAYDKNRAPSLTKGKEIGSRKRELHGGELLISRLNPRKGRVWKVSSSKRSKIASTEFVALELNENEVNKDYLYYYLKSANVTKVLVSKVAAATKSRKRVQYSDVMSLKIPIPPLGEQKKIAEKLDKIFKNVNEAKEAQQKAEEIKEKAMRAAISSLFGSLSAERVKLENKCEIIMGSSPPGKSYNEKGVGKKFLQGPKEFGSEYPQTNRYTSEPTKLCEEGDILITVRATLGKLNRADREYCIGRGLAALRTKNDLNQDFLHYFLLIQDHYWSRVSSGSTYKSITKTNLKNLKVPVPPPKEQEKTVEKLDKIREKVNNMWDGFKRRKEILEILPKAVLDKAFTGELVEA